MHAIVFSPDAEKVRAFFGDVLGLSSVDAGGGWLIFALPPAELAVHPTDGDGHHELYLMCDDIHATLAQFQGKGIEVAQDVTDKGWGMLLEISLPAASATAVAAPPGNRRMPGGPFRHEPPDVCPPVHRQHRHHALPVADSPAHQVKLM